MPRPLRKKVVPSGGRVAAEPVAPRNATKPRHSINAPASNVLAAHRTSKVSRRSRRLEATSGDPQSSSPGHRTNGESPAARPTLAPGTVRDNQSAWTQARVTVPVVGRSTSRQAAVADRTQSSSPAAARNSSAMRTRHVSRTQTPVANPAVHPTEDSSDELFGLSPGGQAARAHRTSQTRSHSKPPGSTMRQPTSLLRGRATPATESSLLALNRFKPRPRQGSIIRLIQQAGGSEADVTSKLDLDALPFGFDDLLGAGEASVVRSRSGNTTPPLVSSESRSSVSRKRRHSDIQVQVPQSPARVASSPPAAYPASHGGDDDDDDGGNHHLQAGTGPEVIPDTQDQIPEHYSDIMAPPLSSSSVLSDAITIPSSPVKKNTRHGSQVSTLHLQSLLPKTRRAQTNLRPSRIGTYDESSVTDLSELRSFPSSSPLSSSSSSSSSSTSSPQMLQNNRQAGQSSRSHRAKRAVRLRPGGQSDTRPAASTSLTKTTRLTARKYTSRTSAAAARQDKENARKRVNGNDKEDEAQDATRPLSAHHHDDHLQPPLEREKERFRQIDLWEMEYETVEPESENSLWR